jgi:hypothetical protein
MLVTLTVGEFEFGLPKANACEGDRLTDNRADRLLVVFGQTP